MAELIRVFAAPGAAHGGNPAPVWLDADAMSSAEMQAATRASGHESVFVLRPDSAAHAFRLRYFVPNHEMEMCGHATIAALWLLHQRGDWDGSPTALQTLSGTVHGRLADGMVEISQPRGQVQALDTAQAQDIAQCLGIDARVLVGPVLNAATSRVKTLVRLPDLATLHGLRVDFTQVQAVCERIGSTGLYPYALVLGRADTVSARQFPRSSGYPEDAATGIAAAALAWGLREQGLVGDADVLVTVRQGEAMGSPSQIGVRLPARDAPDAVCWLRGEASNMEHGHGHG
ncbi:MAG: hypothetical protein JWP29_1245 [Rhodoferax sp.]|nr:hypothetical protein [Rhodoferax sp.]